jgi:Ca2+/H+ antiporter, TMEM165/GDT1 family
MGNETFSVVLQQDYAKSLYLFTNKHERMKEMSGILVFLFAAGAVTLAEMGDKTQLLAMAFAGKYKASKVLIGVFIATVFNHALAVAAGNYITRWEGAQVWIQGIAALSFIFFGLWTIRGDKLDGEDQKKTKFGPILTVTIAFFIAELGDKTQLATIALAAQFPLSPIPILMGTTTGMLIADGIGIIIGVVLGRSIPERTVKLVSAAAFILFGFIGCYQVGANMLGIAMPIVFGILGLIAAITAVAAYILMKNEIEEQQEEELA